MTNMDRFRFRAWDIKGKKWIDPTKFAFPTSGEIMVRGMGTNFYIRSQCTGLKDAEGNLIWEGDVIKGPFDYGPGGWATRCGVVEWSNIHGYQWQYWQVTRCKVLGNIYENPELLEADEK